MKNKPTIAAIIMLLLSLSLSFYITVYDQKAKLNKNDVEIFITKQPIEIPKQLIEFRQKSLIIKIRLELLDKLKNQRQFMDSLIDSYEYEISDFWKEVLNNFEIFEYFKAYPEAFLRRLILMPTFTGNKEWEIEEIDDRKPPTYPDYDYRSMRYRVSLVPDTIERTKLIIDFLYNRINMSLGAN